MKQFINHLRNFSIALLCIASAQTSAAPKITDNHSYKHPQTNIIVVGASVALPSKGTWSIAREGNDKNGFTDLLLEVPELIKQRNVGIRETAKKERRERNKNKYLLKRMYRQIEKLARENNGTTIQDIDLLMVDKRFKPKEVANVFLFSATKPIVEKDGKRWQRTKEKKPLLFELNPLIDDGKQWVVYTNGMVELVEIDKKLVKKYGFSIKAQKASLQKRLEEIAVSADYKIIARLNKGLKPSPQLVNLHNIETGKSLELRWTPKLTKTQDESLLKSWATKRLQNWLWLLKNGDVGYLSHWIVATQKQYKISKMDALLVDPRSRFRSRATNNRSSNLFGVLGGRAAIRETLQLQHLMAESSSSEKQDIAIEIIKGVEVKSHPFTEMLAGKKGGSLAMANIAPNDRFFAWFANPKDFIQYLDGGSDFIFNAGSTISGKSNNHQLKERYLNKIGVDANWAKRFLESDAVTEMAVILPDLFLLDGTDITLALKLKNPDSAKALLSLLKINTSNDVVIHEHKYGKSYWSIHNDLLMLSTNANELEKVRALAQATESERKNSLGQSAEFKYMLTKLPIEKKSHSFFYFSDPFIRHLVGPQVKIAQLRRLQARTEMESAAAARLLYKVDGHSDQPDLKTLVDKDYLNSPVLVKDLKFEADGSVSSASWGTPADMPTLLDHQIILVSRSEKKAYEEYMSGYNRFWRRFFDPIAIRLNLESEHEMEVSTFILPLIDNSIYQQLRDILVSSNGSTKQQLTVPKLTPEPVAQLSFNLNKKLWEKNTDVYIQKFLTKFIGIPSRVGDYFGPDVHLALADSDPIIVMGSGGLAGIFGAMDGSGRAAQSLTLPFIGSLLTRPSVLMIGLTDVDAVKNIMHSMASGPAHSTSFRGFGDGSFVGIADKDAWRYELNIEGIIGMRFGIEIKDRFLMISNQPLSYNPQLLSSDIALNNGAAFGLSPSAAVKQRPALFASASAQQQKSALSGNNLLYPFMISGTKSIDEALKKVKTQLGFLPVHPGTGNWQWKNGQVSSSTYGDAQQQFQTEYKKDEAFGILRDIERVNMNMQFEDDGLRAQVRWQISQ